MERYCLWQITYGAPKERLPLLNKGGCSLNTALYIMRKFQKASLQLCSVMTNTRGSCFWGFVPLDGNVYWNFSLHFLLLSKVEKHLKNPKGASEKWTSDCHEQLKYDRQISTLNFVLFSPKLWHQTCFFFLLTATPGYQSKMSKGALQPTMEEVALTEDGQLPPDYVLKDPESHFIYVCQKSNPANRVNSMDNTSETKNAK
jgi:hypothetical protein